MLSECIFYDNDSVYKKDRILYLNLPEIFKLEKETVIYIHNIDIENNELYKYMIQNKFTMPYKIIYTINNSEYDLGNFKDEIDKKYNDKLYTIILISNIKYNIDKFNNNINIINIVIDNNNLNIFINQERYNLSNKTYEYINNISHNKIINIISSNISYLNNYKIEDIDVDDNLYIYIEKSNKDFNNYITIEMNGFKNIVYKIKLININNINFKNQLFAIKNYIIKNLKTSINKKNYYKIKAIYSHTIKYFNKFLNTSNNIYKEYISLLNFYYNLFQDHFLKNNITNQVSDNLFNRSLDITHLNIKEKLYDIYIKNRNKIITNNLILNNEIYLDDEKPDILEKSLDFYTSLISLTNWKDEIENNSFMGLLINTTCEKLAIMGFTSESIQIKNITNTFITPEQIYDGQKYYYDKYHILDNGKNPDDSILKGSSIGNGNSILPLYINKYHWINVLNKLEENISIAITQNPYSYKPLMLDIYYHVLLESFNNLIHNEISNKDLIILIGIIVTIKNLNLKFSQDVDLINIIKNNNIKAILGSYFMYYLNNDIIIKEEILFYNIYEEITRRNMRKNYKNNNCIKIIFNDDNTINNNNLMYILNQNQENTKELYSLFIFLKFKNEINELINIYETNLGYISEDNIQNIKEKIKKNKVYSIRKLYNLDRIMHFILQTFLTRYNKNRIKCIQNSKYVDSFKADDDSITKNINKLLSIINR